MRSGFIQPLFVLLLLALIVSTCFLYAKNKSYKYKLSLQNTTIEQMREQVDALRGYREVEKPIPSPIPSDADFKLKSKPNLALTKNWKTYKNSDFGLEVKYPQDWITQTGGQLFPQGNLAVFTAKNSTEEAAFGIANPIKTSYDVKTWYKDIYKLQTIAPEPLLDELVNGMTFQKKFVYGRLCITSYFVKKGDYIFEFLLSTWCQKEDVDKYDQTLVNIINTLKFTN